MKSQFEIEVKPINCLLCGQSEDRLRPKNPRLSINPRLVLGFDRGTGKKSQYISSVRDVSRVRAHALTGIRGFAILRFCFIR
jgi:hypothetical protein